MQRLMVEQGSDPACWLPFFMESGGSV
jgi:hypothetical protein